MGLKPSDRLATTLALTASLSVALLVFAAILGTHGYSVTGFARVVSSGFWPPENLSWRLSSIFINSLPVLFPALGLIVAFRMGFWNIGAEGQLLVGMAAATWVGVFLADRLPGASVLPAMVVAAFVAGALWAAGPALLRVWLGVNEVLTTLMLNYVAVHLVNYLVEYRWKDPRGFGFIRTPPLHESARMGAAEGAILVALAAGLVYFMLRYTRLGFELRIIGSSPKAARYAGISYAKVTLLAMLISGGLAGLGGMSVVAGLTGELMEAQRMSPGYGYTGIIAAWLGRLHPAAVVAASLFLGLIYERQSVLQATMRLGVGYTMLFNGLLLFAAISSTYLEKRLREAGRLG